LKQKMLSVDDFQPVTLDDKPLFDEHYKKYPPLHSDNLFTTLISWSEYGRFKHLFKDENLILVSQIRDNVQIRFPIGKTSRRIVNSVLKLAKKLNVKHPLGFIVGDVKNWLASNYPGLKLVPERDFFDYVYLSSDLAELRGSAYRAVRNKLNKFKRNFNYETEEISEDNMKEVKKFLRRWCIWRDCESDLLLSYEKKAVLYSMKHFFELGLSGITLVLNGRIEAIAVYEKMSHDVAVIHYEKASPYYDGIYKAINMETARVLREKFKFINRESDMGIPGLRQAKMSYRPHHMVEVYSVEKDSGF